MTVRGETVTVTVPAGSAYLSLLRGVTSALTSLFGMAERGREEVKLAVDEACANVIRHAYRNEPGGKIKVAFTLGDSFQVVIEDSGIKADPELVRGRDLDDVRPGGLGVHFIRKTFDVVAFDGRKKNGNRLRLVRHRRAEDEDRNSRD